MRQSVKSDWPRGWGLPGWMVVWLGALRMRMTGAAARACPAQVSHEADELRGCAWCLVLGALMLICLWGLTRPMRWSLSTALSCFSGVEGVIGRDWRRGRRKYEDGCTK